MSTIVPPESVWFSEDWQLEKNGDLKPTNLFVELRRCAHVFPWFRFVHAEGHNDLVEITFTSHLVTVTGHGLAALVAALAAQQLVRLIQPSENQARFGVRGLNAARTSGPGITDITVEEVK